MLVRGDGRESVYAASCVHGHASQPQSLHLSKSRHNNSDTINATTISIITKQASSSLVLFQNARGFSHDEEWF